MTLATTQSLSTLRFDPRQHNGGDPVAESRRTVLAWLMAYTADDEIRIRQMMNMVGVEVSIPRRAVVMSVAEQRVTAARPRHEAGRPTRLTEIIGDSQPAIEVLDRIEPAWSTDFFCRAGDRSYVFWTVRRDRSNGDADGICDIVGPAWHRLGAPGRLLVALGRVAADGRSLKRSLDEAETCLALLENGVCDDSGPVQVLRAEQAHVYQLLRLVKDEAGLRAFVHQWIGPLIEHDDNRGTDLVRTLEVYLDTGGSLREAAACLYLHPRGVRYRLDRMFELLGVECPTPDWKLTVHVAVKASRLLRVSPAQKRPLDGAGQVNGRRSGLQPVQSTKVSWSHD